MMVFAVYVAFLSMSIAFIAAAWHELLCLYWNPLPLFNNNNEKRFAEIVRDKTKDYKTRSLLSDAGYAREGVRL